LITSCSDVAGGDVVRLEAAADCVPTVELAGGLGAGVKLASVPITTLAFF
jgi:hypothetical protein